MKPDVVVLSLTVTAAVAIVVIGILIGMAASFFPWLIWLWIFSRWLLKKQPFKWEKELMTRKRNYAGPYLPMN